MESSRFDALTRLFARPASRRKLAGGVAALFPLSAAAQPKPVKCLANGRRCAQRAGAERHGDGKGKHSDKGKRRLPSCAKCCSRQSAVGPNGKPRCACKAEGVACANPSQCCGGICRDGSCTGCPGDLTACNGNCVDLQTDPNHCGSCANACGNAQRCQDGRCVCDGASCPNGCCDNRQTCQRGTSDQACGDGGAACQACGECHACDGTQCSPQSNVCCGDKAVCQTGACQACAQGQRCQRGACVCDATSCANGCCDGATCVSFADQTNERCGTGGAACAACAGSDTCGGGGTNGVCGCTPDPDATTCQGKCGPVANNCGVEVDCTKLCAGCCDGATCRAGDDNAACGANGNACVPCQEVDTCGGGGTAGQCGCTRNCFSKCNGQDDSCGGTCGCPKCQKCIVLAPGVEYCGIDYEQVCDDGQRCCLGRCPAAGCTKPNNCCSSSDVFACQNICCATSISTVPPTTCPSTQFCGKAFTGKLCNGDSDCAAGAELCECGQCCKVSGKPCSQPADCCSFACGSNGTCV